MHYIEYLGVRLVIFILGLLPFEFAMWFSRKVGVALYYFMGRRRCVTFENIDKIYGASLSVAEKRIIARSSFENMVVAIIELCLVKKTKKKVEQRFQIYGREYMDEAFREGKGALLAVAHFGSWEYLAFLPYLSGTHWSVVVKELKNPYLHAYIDQLRRAMTIAPVVKNSSMRPILKELKQNHGVAILIDQWAGGEGIWVDFFNHKTSTTSIPVRLAKKFNCPVMPAYCLRQPGGCYEIHIHPPNFYDAADPQWEKNTTERLNALLEEQILKYPRQWLWNHRRWKSKPSFNRQDQ